MKEFWNNLMRKLDTLLEREPTHVRLLAWRNRVTKVLFFLDNNLYRILVVGFVFGVWFGLLHFLFWRAPSPFPEQALISVSRGESLSQIANDFEAREVVRSAFWLKSLIVIWGGEKRVVAGDYYFPEAKNVFGVAYILHKGEFGLIPIRMTIPEGSSSFQIADILESKLPAFNRADFIKQVDEGGFEGFLFPDTYFFMPNTKAEDVILMMRENFARQIKPYEADIAKFQKPLSEVTIMASIIEDESNKNLNDKRIISGILWKRLRLNMPLQVDAPFQYYNGKNSYTLTKDDLAEDHPYNTYLKKGLPPTAISNPGIDSIRAAITPTQTKYLYFLSDKSGNMYYANDFEGHKRNRELYLN